LLFLLACQQPAKQVAKPSAQPQVRATVVTIQTKIEPGNKSFTTVLVIAGDLARSLDELDHWRLYDTKKNSVTFVDEIAKTSHTESFAALSAARRAADAKPLPDSLPRAELAITSNHRSLQNADAKLSVIRLGGYQRQLWIAQHPLIPTGLFAMMIASRPQLTEAEGVMRAADDALLDVRGFPLADHAELPYGKGRMIVDREVEKIEQKNVPLSLFSIPSASEGSTEQTRQK
jgi:hypothetical protein